MDVVFLVHPVGHVVRRYPALSVVVVSIISFWIYHNRQVEKKLKN